MAAATKTSTAPTDKQVNYALSLLAANGYDTRFMDKSYSRLGATMRQRSGRVEDWLRRMTRPEVSHLIDQLKGA